MHKNVHLHPMKKNLIYLLILAILGILVYFGFRKKKRLFPEKDANFKVEHVEDVTKIFMSDPSTGNIKLSKDANGIWIVNDSFRARQDWVVFLLDGMSKQNASQMVPQSMHNSAIKSLAGSGVKVEVFKGDRKTNSFYVAKEPGKENLTVMLNIQPDGKNASRPFLVKYGFRNTFLGVRYKTDMETWRDKRILHFPSSKLTSIEVVYPKKPAASFALKASHVLSIQPASDSTGEAVNAARLKKYRSFYDKLFCMGFENDYILKDTFIKAFQPFAQVKVKDEKNEEQSLDFYYRQVNKGTHTILTVDGEEYDGDSFFGYLNKRDFVLISSATAQKILREHSEFFVQDKDPTKTKK